eukprot:123505-Prorocentrum_minimum.AAC.3
MTPPSPPPPPLPLSAEPDGGQGGVSHAAVRGASLRAGLLALRAQDLQEAEVPEEARGVERGARARGEHRAAAADDGRARLPAGGGAQNHLRRAGILLLRDCDWSTGEPEEACKTTHAAQVYSLSPHLTGGAVRVDPRHRSALGRAQPHARAATGKAREPAGEREREYSVSTRAVGPRRRNISPPLMRLVRVSGIIFLRSHDWSASPEYSPFPEAVGRSFAAGGAGHGQRGGGRALREAPGGGRGAGGARGAPSRQPRAPGDAKGGEDRPGRAHQERRPPSRRPRRGVGAVGSQEGAAPISSSSSSSSSPPCPSRDSLRELVCGLSASPLAF